MLNKAILMGRLTREPEMRQTTSGRSVASFTLAVDRGISRDQQNSDVQTTDFIDIVCWERQAEFVSKYFTKGMLVAVAGKIQQRKWQDKEGNNRYSFEVVANEVHFAESKRDSASGGRNFVPPHDDNDLPRNRRTPSASEFTELVGPEDDDVPF